MGAFVTVVGYTPWKGPKRRRRERRKERRKKKKKKKNYSTEYSHVVPHHSTDSAINCLTAQIGRDAVGLVVYGRNSKVKEIYIFKYRPPAAGISRQGITAGIQKFQQHTFNFRCFCLISDCEEFICNF
jgi:hypothetical protein